ncbi:hypothetical protein I203_107909 [Kwoniella mangroviensis CBS 8507]|nr:uncharacterized protein I203_04803 [Kwoniella mangroviensis CBS 8507]OCF65785.1 hypothetical protein I203_04803 [Kwoniella mangroviensis CBS 8507]
MPAPRPPHSIELTIPHVLTQDQFDELEDLTFLHFEENDDAWPISLKITSELSETIPEEDPEGDMVKVETTTISIATSVEWNVENEEKMRSIVRGLLVEIMGGG